MRVLGLGGVFLKARNPQQLGAWYQKHLGIEINDFGGPYGAVINFRESEPGYQVWTAFPQASTYFEGPVMVNFRVADLHGLLNTLRAESVWVDEKIDESEYGKFGWIQDGEGNRIELWQPPA